MVEASAVGLFRTVGIILLILFVVRLFTRMARMRAANEKMANNVRNANQKRAAAEHAERQARTVKDDGKVRVEYKRGNHPPQKTSDDDDEYVDYEIVD